LLALLAVACAAQMASAETKVVTDDDKGSTIQMKMGDTLEVRLSANPSTGYMWYLHPKSTALLRLSRQTQTESTEPGVGRPIVQIFTFEPKRVGDGILLLRYVRSWEKPVLGEKQFTLNVSVE
jgi:inhibitor of cysteine peptidase